MVHLHAESALCLVHVRAFHQANPPFNHFELNDIFGVPAFGKKESKTTLLDAGDVVDCLAENLSQLQGSPAKSSRK